MTKTEKKAIKSMQRHLLDELNKIEKVKEPNERLEKLDVLWNINRYFENYEDLKPVMQKFFIEKARKEKFGER